MTCSNCGHEHTVDFVCESCGMLFPSAQPRNAFAWLGLPSTFIVDLPAAESRYRELSRAVHPDFFATADAAQQSLATRHSSDINDAWALLQDPWQRAALLLTVYAPGATVDRKSIDQILLMDILEIREALEGDSLSQPEREAITQEYRSKLVALQNQVQQALGLLQNAPDDPDKAQAVQTLLNERKYYQNIIEVAEQVETT